MSQQINLFNPIFLKQKKYFSAIAMAQALGMIVLGAVLVAAYAKHQVSRLTEEAAQTTAQLASAKADLVRIKAEHAPRAKNKATQEQLQRLEGEVQALQQIFETMQKGEFGNTRGYSEYLRAFSRQIVDGVWLTGVTIQGAGSELGLEGRALQPELVPAYITRLKKEQVLQGKSFAGLEMRLPQEAAPAARADAGKSPAAGYIEFTLQSGQSKDQTDSGARK